MHEWITAAHLASVLVFTGGLTGLFIVSVVISDGGATDTETGRRLKQATLKWDRRISLPALVLVWSFGMWAALDGGWFSQPWLLIKLLFVIFLSGLHAVLSGRLRRVPLQTATATSTPPTVIVAAILVCLVAIATLAVVRPF